jgi:hypothetical protein
METYEFDFSYDDGNWEMHRAYIGDGVLNMYYQTGYSQDYAYRYPESDWVLDDDFEIEINAKNDNNGYYYRWRIAVTLVGDPNAISFIYNKNDGLVINYDYEDKVILWQDLDDTDWHNMKVRRTGTIYYVSADSGEEISFDYQISRELESIMLERNANPISLPGKFDNFKYSWEGGDQAFIG